MPPRDSPNQLGKTCSLIQLDRLLTKPILNDGKTFLVAVSFLHSSVKTELLRNCKWYTFVSNVNVGNSINTYQTGETAITDRFPNV